MLYESLTVREESRSNRKHVKQKNFSRQRSRFDVKVSETLLKTSTPRPNYMIPGIRVPVLLAMANTLVSANIVIMMPLLAFIGRDMQISSFWDGVILIAFPTTAFVLNILLGPFIDHFGRGRFILIGGIGCSVMFTLTALAKSSAELALFRAITAIFMPMIGASIYATVMDYYPPTQQAKTIGNMLAVSGAFQILVVPLSTVVAEHISWRVPLLALAAISAVLVVLASRLAKPPYFVAAHIGIRLGTYWERLLSFSRNAILSTNLLAYFLTAIGRFTLIGFYFSWVIIRSRGSSAFGVDAASLLFLLGGIGNVLGSWAFGKFGAHSRHPARLVCWMLLISSAAGLGTCLAPYQFTIEAACFVTFSFGSSFVVPAVITSALQTVASQERSSFNGYSNALFQAGSAIGSGTSAILYRADPSFVGNAVTTAAIMGITTILFAYRHGQQR